MANEVNKTMAPPGTDGGASELRDDGIMRHLAEARHSALSLMEEVVLEKRRVDDLNAQLVREVAQRRRSESALRGREFESVISRTPFLLARCTDDLRYRFVSRSYAIMLGRSPEDLVGKPLKEVLGDKAFKVLEPYIEQVLSGDEVEFDAELSLTGIGARTLHISYLHDQDENGKVVGWIEAILDLTARKQAEEALRESEDRFQLLSESFHDYAIFTVDPDGNVVTWNPGGQEIFGYSEEEIIGQNGRILFVPEDQQKGEAEKEMQTARTKGRSADERWHLRKDGGRFYASGIMAPLYDGPELIGYAKIARDLTKEKRMQDELQRQHEELESIVAGRTSELAKANIALVEQMKERRRIEEERFALLQQIVTTQEDERRRIARDIHDSLGQQLTAMRLKLASMKTELASNRVIGESLEKLEELGKRIDSEVNFLVWELRPTVLDDLGLVAALDNYVREWSKHVGTPAEFQVGRVGAERLDPNIETNLYRISQEALNNTYKHSKAKGASVLLESRRDDIVLVVEDDGVGFEIENLKSVQESGRGLGLIGMRERATIIGGSIEIESAPGKGTTVFVRVPLTGGVKNAGNDKDPIS